MSLAAMDPNLFHLDWDRTVEVLAAIVLLSMVVERALSVVFESNWWIESFSRKDRHLKEPIAFGVSFLICVVWDFDAVSMLILAERTNWFGAAITAGVIAGGSKGSVTLFREWIGFKSTARGEYEKEKPKDGNPPPAAPPVPPPAPDESELAPTKPQAKKTAKKRKKTTKKKR